MNKRRRNKARKRKLNGFDKFINETVSIFCNKFGLKKKNLTKNFVYFDEISNFKQEEIELYNSNIEPTKSKSIYFQQIERLKRSNKNETIKRKSNHSNDR